MPRPKAPEAPASLRRTAHGLLILGLMFVAVAVAMAPTALQSGEFPAYVFVLSAGSAPVPALGLGGQLLLGLRRSAGTDDPALMMAAGRLPKELMCFGLSCAVLFVLIPTQLPGTAHPGYWVLAALCVAAAAYGLRLSRMTATPRAPWGARIMATRSDSTASVRRKAYGLLILGVLSGAVALAMAPTAMRGDEFAASTFALSAGLIPVLTLGLGGLLLLKARRSREGRGPDAT